MPDKGSYDKPRLLDLFCGAGGCSAGYHRAGFEVVGVDNRPQKNYPFEFRLGDALDVAGWLANGEHDFDAVHASPPCQAHSTLRVRWRDRDYPELIAPTRDLLRAAGLPYVIENVMGAPLLNPVQVCGAALGLGTDTHQLARHRLFEANFPIMVAPCAHGSTPIVGVYGGGPASRPVRGYQGSVAEKRTAMGIDWMTSAEINQAIPPAYTEHIGHYLLAELTARTQAA